MLTNIFNEVYSIGTLVTIFIAILTLVTFVFFMKEENVWLSYIKKNTLNLYIFLLSLAVLGSLFYSEVAMYTPCKLCWIQRIFIYPQLIIAIIAKVRKENVFLYLRYLTGFGILFSLLHNYIYYFGEELSFTCDAAASCKAFYIYMYDIVTIPLMALALLVSMGVILLIQKYYSPKIPATLKE